MTALFLQIATEFASVGSVIRKYWEIIADKLSAAGWSWGYCSAVTSNGWCWIVDAYKSDGKRYIVESDELLSAFGELEAITYVTMSNDEPQSEKRRIRTNSCLHFEITTGISRSTV